jgi:hypothetical protein
MNIKYLVLLSCERMFGDSNIEAGDWWAMHANINAERGGDCGAN